MQDGDWQVMQQRLKAPAIIMASQLGIFLLASLLFVIVHRVYFLQTGIVKLGHHWSHLGLFIMAGEGAYLLSYMVSKHQATTAN